MARTYKEIVESFNKRKIGNKTFSALSIHETKKDALKAISKNKKLWEGVNSEISKMIGHKVYVLREDQKKFLKEKVFGRGMKLNRAFESKAKDLAKAKYIVYVGA